ncbi:MAG: DUF389 domain-containing protein [Microcoleaceae cyanobacterium]
MQATWKFIQNLGLGVVPFLKLRESLLIDSRLSQNYLVLTVSSCLIATLGLLINSAAVIIGAMIIAPLMLPLRGLAFATLEGDVKLLRLSFNSIAIGTLLSLLFSGLLGLIINIPDFGSEILSRTEPTLIDLLIAICAGSISGYSKIRPALGDAIPGTAIAVALMPPVCVIGLALSQGSWDEAMGASLLYITNLIGINLACIIIYVLGGYAKSSEVARTLSWGISLLLIMLLAAPLGISFWRLINHANVNKSVKEVLVTRSLVDRPDIEVIDLEIDWRRKPANVLVIVRATDPVTPQEVSIVEQVLSNELDVPFRVVFDVTPSTLVEAQR